MNAHGQGTCAAHAHDWSAILVAGALVSSGSYELFHPNLPFLNQVFVSSSAELEPQPDADDEYSRITSFLAGLAGEEVERGVVTKRVTELARAAFEQLRSAFPRIAPPVVAAGARGEVGLTWDRGDDHLEVEFLADGAIEAFYRNRSTRSTWSKEASDVRALIEAVGRAPALFVGEPRANERG